MEGIFFISPIWWIFSISGFSIMITLIGGVFIGVSVAYRLSRKNLNSDHIFEKPIFSSIDSTDPNYATKTLIQIRRYLSSTHYPMHSWAHVPKDMKSYTTDRELIAIIEQLEQIEFSGKIPEQKILISIHQDLLRKFSS